MRRILSIFVLLAVALPMALPVFAGAPQEPHACCRRMARRCHMSPAKGPGFSNREAICRCSPRTAAAFAPVASSPSRALGQLGAVACSAPPQILSYCMPARGGRAPPASPRSV